MSTNVLYLKPLEFAHILDLNANVTYVETGPGSLMLQENQQVVFGPARSVIVPAGHYCRVENPVKLPVAHGTQAQLQCGYSVIRLHQVIFRVMPKIRPILQFHWLSITSSPF